MAVGRASVTLSSMDIARFTEKLAPRENGCIEWTGYSQRTGGKYGYPYGILSVRSLPILAHRIAYTLAHGPIETGYVVMHACDNGLCCNPAHLSLGTKYENSMDMVRKGRSPRGDRHSSKTHPESVAKGEGHHWHVLADADVSEIRRRYAAGEGWTAIHRVSYSHVSVQTVMRIALRQTWRHLP